MSFTNKKIEEVDIYEQKLTYDLRVSCNLHVIQ